MDILKKLMTEKRGWTPVEVARTAGSRKRMKRYCKKVAKQKLKQQTGGDTYE